MNQLFIVRLDEQRYALRLQDVERVVSMVEITALPEAPAAVLGLINAQGRILTVIDLRSCLNLPAREVDLDDVLVIVRTAAGMVALAVDGVEGVSPFPEQATVSGQEIVPAPVHLEGVVKFASGLVLICDLDQLVAAGSVAGGAPQGGDDAR